MGGEPVPVMRKWIQEGLEAKAPSVHCLGCTSTGVGILSDLRGRDEARRGERNQDRQKEESGSHSELHTVRVPALFCPFCCMHICT